MKKVLVLLSALTLMMAFGSVALAGEATPKEAIAKAQEAVKLIQEKGDAAYDVIRDKKGPFVWKDSYIVVNGLSGTIIVHPYVPKLEGRNMNSAKDSKGKLFHAETVAVAKNKGQGWVDYWWNKPGQKTPSQKSSYVLRVPGKDVYVLAGVWDMTAAQAEAAAK
jgi:cytochrome c